MFGNINDNFSTWGKFECKTHQNPNWAPAEPVLYISLFRELTNSPFTWLKLSTSDQINVIFTFFLKDLFRAEAVAMLVSVMSVYWVSRLEKWSFKLTNVVCVIHARNQMRSKIYSSLSSDYCPQFFNKMKTIPRLMILSLALYTFGYKTSKRQILIRCGFVVKKSAIKPLYTRVIYRYIIMFECRYWPVTHIVHYPVKPPWLRYAALPGLLW